MLISMMTSKLTHLVHGRFTVSSLASLEWHLRNSLYLSIGSASRKPAKSIYAKLKLVIQRDSNQVTDTGEGEAMKPLKQKNHLRFLRMANTVSLTFATLITLLALAGCVRESHSISTRIEPGTTAGQVNLICQASSSGVCLFQISSSPAGKETANRDATTEIINVAVGQKKPLVIPDSSKITTSYCVAVASSGLRNCKPAVISSSSSVTTTSSFSSTVRN